MLVYLALIIHLLQSLPLYVCNCLNQFATPLLAKLLLLSFLVLVCLVTICFALKLFILLHLLSFLKWVFSKLTCFLWRNRWLFCSLWTSFLKCYASSMLSIVACRFTGVFRFLLLLMLMMLMILLLTSSLVDDGLLPLSLLFIHLMIIYCSMSHSFYLIVT